MRTTSQSNLSTLEALVQNAEARLTPDKPGAPIAGSGLIDFIALQRQASSAPPPPIVSKTSTTAPVTLGTPKPPPSLDDYEFEVKTLAARRRRIVVGAIVGALVTLLVVLAGTKLLHRPVSHPAVAAAPTPAPPPPATVAPVPPPPAPEPVAAAPAVAPLAPAAAPAELTPPARHAKAKGKAKAKHAAHGPKMMKVTSGGTASG